MTISHAATTKKTWAVRTGIAGIAAATLAVSGIAIAANAAGPSFAPYDEGDSPNPYNVTEGLVFYRGADMGWVVNAPIADVESLAYTVADGTSYAPSFQLVARADRDGFTNKYTRLVWEPYMQAGGLDANAGEYTDLQDGLWWSGSIGSGPGSQSDPQPLNFFSTAAPDGAGWEHLTVTAVDVHQGTTTESTSVVTKVNYNGTDIALGNADATPFKQSDIDAATGPLNGQIADLEDDVDSLQGQLADKVDELADAQTQLGTAQTQLGAAQTQLGTALTQYGVAQSALTAYKANHHNVDGTSIGKSRAALSATPVHGKTVGVKLTGSIAKATSVKYQWYLGGKAVSGATKSTYQVPANAKGKSVSVAVTGTYKYVTFGVHSNTTAAR